MVINSQFIIPQQLLLQLIILYYCSLLYKSFGTPTLTFGSSCQDKRNTEVLMLRIFKSLDIISITFFPVLFSSILGLWVMGHLPSGSYHSRKYQQCAHSHGMGLRLDLSLLVHSYNLFHPYLCTSDRQTVGIELCVWIGVPISALEVLPIPRKWTFKAMYSLFLRAFIEVILTDSWEFLLQFLPNT